MVLGLQLTLLLLFRLRLKAKYYTFALVWSDGLPALVDEFAILLVEVKLRLEASTEVLALKGTTTLVYQIVPALASNVAWFATVVALLFIDFVIGVVGFLLW